MFFINTVFFSWERPPKFDWKERFLSYLSSVSHFWCLVNYLAVSWKSFQDTPRGGEFTIVECSAVALFRLTAGQLCLGSHFHRMRFLDGPRCKLCNSGETQNYDHLLQCAAMDLPTSHSASTAWSGHCFFILFSSVSLLSIRYLIFTVFFFVNIIDIAILLFWFWAPLLIHVTQMLIYLRCS